MRNRDSSARTDIPERELSPDYYIERSPARLELSESTLKTWLHENIKNLERKHGWKTPFVALLPLLFTLMTVTFKNVFGLRAETCRFIWIIIICLVALWLLSSIFVCFKSKSINEMVSDLKRDMIRISPQ